MSFVKHHDLAFYSLVKCFQNSNYFQDYMLKFLVEEDLKPHLFVPFKAHIHSQGKPTVIIIIFCNSRVLPHNLFKFQIQLHLHTKLSEKKGTISSIVTRNGVGENNVQPRTIGRQIKIHILQSNLPLVIQGTVLIRVVGEMPASSIHHISGLDSRTWSLKILLSFSQA